MTSPADPSHPALALLGRHALRVDASLREFLATHPAAPARLMESVAYSLTAGGKRLRPALVLEFATACSATGDEPRATVPPLALAAAGAVELIHTFSLVHDDLPAMDDDDLRRGRPTNHKVYGEAMAILAGDAMTTMAFQFLARHASDARNAVRCASLIHELALASGPEGMIGGQVLDIEGEGTSLDLVQLRRLHGMKTGALLRASCRMGVIAAGGSDAQLAAATAYGEHLGLAFQITDDLLDLTATPEQLGKATHKDQSKGKNTYPALLGIDGAQQQARQEVAAAVGAIQVFGDSRLGLKHLAEFVTHRTH